MDRFEDMKKIHLESQEEEILKEVYNIFSKQIPMKLQVKNNFTCATFSEQLQEKDKFIIVYFENIINLLGDLINKSVKIENKDEKLIKIIEDMQTNVQVLLREIKEKQSKDPQDSIFLEIMKCFVKHLQRVNLSHAENIIISRSRINKIQQNSVRKNDTPSQEIIEQPIISKLNQILRNNNQAVVTPQEEFFSRGGLGRNTLPARLKPPVSVVSGVKDAKRIPPQLLPKPKKMDESSSEDIPSQKNVFEKWGISLRSKKPEDPKDQGDLEGVSFKMKK